MIPVEKQQQLVSKYLQRFRNSASSKTGIIDKWKILDMFDRSEQWKNANLPPWVPKPVTNYIRYIRTMKRANLSSAIPRCFIAPELEDQADFIERLKKAHDHVWEDSKVPRVIRRCIDRSRLLGTSIVVVYTDDVWYGQYYNKENPKNRLFQGKICVKRFPIERFFPDVDAYRIEDMKHCDTTEDLPLSYVKANEKFMEYAGEKLKNYTGATANDDQATGAIYNRDNNPGTASTGIQGDEMVTLHTHYDRHYKDGRWHIDRAYYLENADFLLYYEEDIQPNEYPFAVLYDEEEEYDFWGSSDCMMVLENQKIINRVDQTVGIIATLHQNPQKVVSRESGINAQELSRTGTLPGKVWTANGDPSKAIHIAEPMDIPKGLFDVKTQMVNDVKDMVGVNEAYTGQSVGSLTTSTGVNALIERATLRDRDKMVQIDEFVERISHLILMNILWKWQDKRPVAVTQPDGSVVYENYEPIAKDVAENLSWRIKSNVYATAPMTQATLRQQADQLMQLQGQFNFQPPIITSEEWIEFQDFDKKDVILKRMHRDRARMEAEKAQQLAQKITQTAELIRQQLSQGVAPQEAQAMAMQEAQKWLDEQQAAAMASGRPRDAAKSASGPEGLTGQQAMMNMAQGR